MPEVIKDRSAEAGILIAHFSQLNKGDVVSYEKIQELIGWDIRENRGPMYTCCNRIRRDYGKTIRAVTNDGYKVLTDKEVCEEELERDRRHRRRSALRSKDKASTVDMANLTESQKLRLLGEVTAAHVVAEASTGKAVERLQGRLNGDSQPLALNNALEAIKKNLSR